MEETSGFSAALEVQLGILRETLFVAHCEELEKVFNGEAQMPGVLPDYLSTTDVSLSDSTPRSPKECAPIDAFGCPPKRSRVVQLAPKGEKRASVVSIDQEMPARLPGAPDAVRELATLAESDADSDEPLAPGVEFHAVTPSPPPGAAPKSALTRKRSVSPLASTAGSMVPLQAFSVRPAWMFCLSRGGGGGPAVGLMTSSTASLALLLVHGEQEDDEDDVRCLCRPLRRCMIAPNSSLRLSWDLFGMLLIAFDFINVPLLLFDPPDTLFTYAAAWVARLFWLLDIAATFLTGALLEDGMLEMRSRLVAFRYARSWMIFDVLLVAIDWAEVVVSVTETESVSETARLGKLSRTFRMLRMLRLARVVKVSNNMAQASQWMAEVLVSEQLGLLLNIIKSTLSLAVFAHVIACCWYKIGTLAKGAGWVARYNYTQAPLENKYAACLHWAMTQFIGTMDIVGITLEERLFTVLVLLACFVLAAAFVSTITTSMTRLDFLNKERHTQLSLLRRYLWGQGVSTKLSMRITRNALHAAKERSRNVREANVAMLEDISEPLRIELHFEVHSKIFNQHPLLSVYHNEAPVAMRQICHKAVTINSTLSKGDILFSAGERPERPAMLFFMRGELKYAQECAALLDVGPGSWACEAVLWTNWVHRGVLQSQSECTVLELDALKFLDTMKHAFNADSDMHPAKYATHFVSELNDLDAMDLSDLDMDFGLPEPLEQAYISYRAASKGRHGSVLAPRSAVRRR